DGGVQRQSAMRRGAVQVDGCAENRNLNQHDRDSKTEDQRTKHASTSKAVNNGLPRDYPLNTKGGTRRDFITLPASALEFLHEIDELIHARLWKSVVKRRPNAPNRTMPLETVQTRGGRFLDEGL